MEVHAQHVALVMPHQLEIYALEHSSDALFAHMLHELELPRPFAFARLIFDDGYDHVAMSALPHVVMRLFLTKWDEVRVYEALFPRPEEPRAPAADEETEHGKGK